MDLLLMLIIHYAANFFISEGILWQRDLQGAHKCILYNE